MDKIRTQKHQQQNSGKPQAGRFQYFVKLEIDASNHITII